MNVVPVSRQWTTGGMLVSSMSTDTTLSTSFVMEVEDLPATVSGEHMKNCGKKGFFHDVAGGKTAESETNLVPHGAIAARGGRMRKEFGRVM